MVYSMCVVKNGLVYCCCCCVVVVVFRKQQQIAMKKEQDEKEEEMVGKEIIVIDGKTSATIWLWPDYSYLYFTTIHSYWHEEEKNF